MTNYYTVIVGTAYAVVECPGTMTPVDKTITAMTRNRTSAHTPYPNPIVRPATDREVRTWDLLMEQSSALRQARSKAAKLAVSQEPLFQ